MTPGHEWRAERPTWRARAARLARTRLPGFVKPLLRELKYRLRPDPEIAVLEAEVLDLQSQWRAIVDRSNDDPSEAAPATQHVLFVTGFGLGTAFVTREAILMMALRTRGARLSSLYCDITLPACEFNSAGSHVPDAGSLSRGLTTDAKLATCRRCASNVRSTMAELDVPVHSYHEYLEPGDLERAEGALAGVTFENYRSFTWDGVQVGEEVFASVLRATFMGTVEDTPLNRQLVQRYLLSGVVMAMAAGAAYRALRPDRIMMPHGVYITHGIAAKVARRMGIPLFVYGGGVRKDTLIISPGETYHRTLVEEPNDTWENAELTPGERQRTLDYALSKQSGGVDAVNYHPTPVEDAAALYRELGIDASRPIVSLFTNVIWDAQIFYDGNAFDNILDWMRFSIAELAKNPNVWVVVRIHPAEVKGGLPSLQPFLPEIMKWYPELPANVRVVPPESNLSSYTLAEQSRASIIYGTKMGLELAVRGLPVVVCGQTFSRGKGFTFDISTKAQYAALLERIHELEPLSPELVERALRYAHYLYFRRMMDFPYLTLDDYKTLAGKRIALSTLSDLAPGRDRNLDVICDSVLDLGKPHV